MAKRSSTNDKSPSNKPALDLHAYNRPPAAILATDFFASNDTVAIARALLGHTLCRRLADGSTVRWELTELEAYDGAEDRACHAHKGRTPRTEVMFGAAGHCYVYLCYGMHWLLNIVTGAPGYPAAVLVRGAGPLTGPARVTRALGIDRSLNTAPVGEASGLWFEAAAQLPEAAQVLATPRIGVSYAGEHWANRPYRFVLKR